MSMKAKTKKEIVLIYPNEYLRQRFALPANFHCSNVNHTAAHIATHVAVRSNLLKLTLNVATQYLMAGAKLKNCININIASRVKTCATTATTLCLWLVLTCVAMLQTCSDVMRLRATMKPLPYRLPGCDKPFRVKII